MAPFIDSYRCKKLRAYTAGQFRTEMEITDDQPYLAWVDDARQRRCL